ncbi:SAM-dependent methyltransferase [Actinomycetospora endophytica]|uniref:SAM-dependent methyltransferase n=1 Tax=Actinomycetospora endophytica TaxID=2291215 RepID=A0ABS8P0T0_9PSEU|nr:SAM-dependent methyltransferase [Actinomycetospora endophytica]MCD2191851.1 SAM-dependent methyltransferase [Actinomycetospora endophytica]
MDFAATVGPAVEALSEECADLARVRVVADWVQYRGNFRDPVSVRPFLSGSTVDIDPALDPVPHAPTTRDDDLELALDVRRCAALEADELRHLARTAVRGADHVAIEDWGLTSSSCIWKFNALYWQALDLWEQATGRTYEQALPGGESDARNRTGARALITELFAAWDRLAERNALPAELYVIELGVGNGSQAKVFLDEFAAADRELGHEYYRRLHYLMCDYSAYVLELARKTVAEHDQHVSSFVLDATSPHTALGFLKYKVFLVYISNVYDNLPTDEVAQLGGRTYVVQSRACLARKAVDELAASTLTTPERVPALLTKLLRLGPSLLPEAAPDHFPDVEAAVMFWQRAWSALRLEERYVPVAGLDLYPLTPEISGEPLRPLLESGADLRMHVSNGAVASFVDTLKLLHPFGTLVCHDLFVTDLNAYRTRFAGPGKYDGSVVNWVNGTLLAHLGRRRGFEVTYAPFAHRERTNVVTLTAHVRE